MKNNKNVNKLIDLHTHTNYSDGDLSPYDLIHLAIKSGIGVLGITDHDTLEGIKQIDKNDSLDIVNQVDLVVDFSNGENSVLYKKDKTHYHLYNLKC